MRKVRLGLRLPAVAGAVIAGSLLLPYASYADSAVPKPRVKPAPTPSPSTPPVSAKPVVRPPDETDPTEAAKEIGKRAAAQQCVVALKALGADAKSVERFRTEGGCGIDDPVKITRLRVAGSTISLSGKPTMSCRFALKFADWTANVAAPMARHHLGSDLNQLLVGPGYVCRRRNNAKKGKLSEHAFGNAIDITGLKLSNGERVLISGLPKATGPMKRFLAAARTTACGYFTTVLGPGANAAHSSHFHFDSGRHGRTDRYRICQ